MKHLFCFGMGYSAKALARRLGDDWQVTGTYRSPEAKASLMAADFGQVAFDGSAALPTGALDGVTHLLMSISPGKDGDPVLTQCADQIIAHAGQLDWAGYLSTTGVYGDRAGGWVGHRHGGRSGHALLTERTGQPALCQIRPDPLPGTL